MKLFADFAPVSEAQWIQQVEKDLKGKSFDSLFRTLDESIVLKPFYARNAVTSEGIIAKEGGGDWEICEIIVVDTDIKAANQRAIAALMSGANALTFKLFRQFEVKDLSVLLQDIELSYICTHFECDKIEQDFAAQLLQAFFDVATQHKNNPATLRGSIFVTPILGNYEVEMASMVRYAQANLPLFRTITVDVSRFQTGGEGIVQELTEILVQAKQLFDSMLKLGIDAEVIPNVMQFSVALDMDYFTQIAKIRALRLLWANVLNAYGVSSLFPTIIEARTNPNSYDANDHNTNKIRMTTIAMSAVLGGADRIVLSPTQETDTVFANRIALNVQHILKMESYFDGVADPAAGSYYIETLTEALAQEVWTSFVNI